VTGAAPRVLDARAGLPEREALDAAAAHVLEGGVVAHPTETVYGFGGLATTEAIAAVSRLKPGRDRPFILLVPSADAVPALEWTAEARALAAVFWPGALTLVLADRSDSFPAGVRGESGGVAVRVTSHPVTRALVERLGRPLTSTSANLPGDPPAASGDEALAVARAAGAGAELWVLDVGRLPPSAPSTVVDCTGPVARVLRPGATPLHRLRCVLPEIDAER
jgi:L-threonylcarbamoyladenylate synthase